MQVSPSIMGTNGKTFKFKVNAHNKNHLIPLIKELSTIKSQIGRDRLIDKYFECNQAEDAQT